MVTLLNQGSAPKLRPGAKPTARIITQVSKFSHRVRLNNPPVVGDVVTASAGSWQNSPTSYAYQWQRCQTSCANIGGAASNSYTIQTADIGYALTVVVTATNGVGSATASSAETGIVVNGSGGSLLWVQNWANPFASGQGIGCLPQQASTSTHYHGTYSYAPGYQGVASTGKFSFPATPSGWSVESCVVPGPNRSPVLNGQTLYDSAAVYIPAGWPSGVSFPFWGVQIEEYHFVGVWGAPVALQLHNNHITISLETGSCSPVGSANPGCQFRSNADNASCRSTSTYTCLPGYYAIPPGQLVVGAWNEVIVGVHWASSGGTISAWYKTAGSSTWTPSASVSGIPTLQWNASSGCCMRAWWNNGPQVYTTRQASPLSLNLAGYSEGTTMASVTGQVP